ncbi:MAG: hypothetical protein ACM3SY_16560 [Candidatus Omnitrophota bacterium]
MAEFLLGILIAGVFGAGLVYNCYNKRESTEKKLRQNVGNLEHNMAILKKESEMKIDQLETEIKRLRDENRKHLSKIEIMAKDLGSLREQLEECKQRLG